MFAAVMLDPENCRLVLERILDIKIERVEVSKEKSIIYHPEYKGVRLDIFAEDDAHTHYDVEMQIATSEVRRRSRYYHSQMDMELLSTGVSYDSLPEAYVIFICDFDPFDLGKYRYTVKACFKEDMQYNYNNGTHTVFLSTKGCNDSEVPPELVAFLKYVGAEYDTYTSEFDDELISRIQSSVESIKVSREMGGRYMLFEELLSEERREGREEGKLEGALATQKENIKFILESQNITLSKIEETTLLSIKDADKLKLLFNLALQKDDSSFKSLLNS